MQERGFMKNRNGLQGLELDLNGYSSRLLISVVDVASVFIQKNQDIVLA